MNIYVIISGKIQKIINPGEKISFVEYRHVLNSEASGYMSDYGSKLSYKFFTELHFLHLFTIID